MIIKLDELINDCKREVYKQDCKNCSCSDDQKECLINLINEYNSTCKDEDTIIGSDFE